MKKKILLHACCAPCTAGVFDQLKTNFDVTLFWYNPNIFPKAEHDRRLNELLNFCDQENIRIMVGDYDWVEEHDYWLQLVKGLENEPERGKRCEVCYKMRLEAVAAVAAQANDHHEGEFNFFGAELSISPHKDSEMINEIGLAVENEVYSTQQSLASSFAEATEDRQDGAESKLKYLSSNFKKNDGFKKASEISSKLKLYRQEYCGCEFSKSRK